MAVIILYLSFLLIFITIGVIAPGQSVKQVFIKSALSFSALIVALTEFLSLIRQLKFGSILVSWLIVSIALAAYLFINRVKTAVFINSASKHIRISISRSTVLQKVVIGVLSALFAIIFLEAILWPPNNWDSMTYHMARIASWVSHQSVAPFPTHIIRQLYQPPFAEYAITHFCILAKSDVMANTIQLLYLIFTVVALVAIVSEMGMPRYCKFIAIVFAITIPEVALQASGTQNDLVVAFFIIAAYYFFVRICNRVNLADCIWLGIATGLGLLTKGTGYVFLAPILVGFGVVVIISLIKTRQAKPLVYGIIAGLIAILFNCGYYLRNMQVSHTLLGISKSESKLYSNEKMNAALLGSNLIKNAGLHSGVMFARTPAIFADSLIYRLHRAAGIDINSAANNYRGMHYTTETLVTDEDGAPNPFHFLAILFSLAIVIYLAFKRKGNNTTIILAAIVLTQAIFFSAYLKWQPWHTRLQVSMFLLSTPLICYAASSLKWFRMVAIFFSPIVLAYALLVLIHSERRPLSDAIVKESRYERYFRSKKTDYSEYKAVFDTTRQLNFKRIGLITGVDDWVYPLFSDCFSKRIDPVYINVTNFSAGVPQDDNQIDCIVETQNNKPFIDYKGKRYYNHTAANHILWLYY